MSLDLHRQSVSGDVVAISGATITATVNVSGNVVQISGQSVSANVSGQVVQISGQAMTTNISGNVVNISGQITSVGTSFLPNALTQVNDLSGGVLLPSGAVFSMVVLNMSGNGPIWLGGTGSKRAISGTGPILYASQSIALGLNNFNLVSVFGITSGNYVTSWGVA